METAGVLPAVIRRMFCSHPYQYSRNLRFIGARQDREPRSLPARERDRHRRRATCPQQRNLTKMAVRPPSCTRLRVSPAGTSMAWAAPGSGMVAQGRDIEGQPGSRSTSTRRATCRHTAHKPEWGNWLCSLYALCAPRSEAASD